MNAEFGVLINTGQNTDELAIEVESFYGLEEAKAYARMKLMVYPKGSYKIFEINTGVVVEEG